MAQPQAVQKLKHGKALCGATFGAFVETFNWLVDFCLNLKGDKNANNANGTITVDRSDPSAPVVRWAKKQEEVNGATSNGCWEISINDGTASFSNCYYNTGGVTHLASPGTLSVSDSGIITARFNGTDGFNGVYFRASLAALNTAQDDMSAYEIPLYLINDGVVACDLRNAPQLQVFEWSIS